MPKIIVFDFDGTLLESEQSKQKSFIDLFDASPEIENIAREYVYSNPGKPRREMISGVVDKLIQNDLYSDRLESVEKIVKKYDEKVNERILRIEIGRDAKRMLRFLLDKYTLFVNSNTPQSSLDAIIFKKDLDKYFEKVYGAPPGTKIENLKNIINIKNINPREAIVVGDGESDLESARETGARFIGLANKINGWANRSDIDSINNITSLLKII